MNIQVKPNNWPKDSGMYFFRSDSKSNEQYVWVNKAWCGVDNSRSKLKDIKKKYPEAMWSDIINFHKEKD